MNKIKLINPIIKKIIKNPINRTIFQFFKKKKTTDEVIPIKEEEPKPEVVLPEEEIKPPSIPIEILEEIKLIEERVVFTEYLKFKKQVFNLTEKEIEDLYMESFNENYLEILMDYEGRVVSFNKKIKAEKQESEEEWDTVLVTEFVKGKDLYELFVNHEFIDIEEKLNVYIERKNYSFQKV
jgi:hypothetical protein